MIKLHDSISLYGAMARNTCDSEALYAWTTAVNMVFALAESLIQTSAVCDDLTDGRTK